MGVLLLLGYLLLRALGVEAEELAKLVLRPRNLRLLQNTLLLAAGVLALDVLLALPLAWLTTRSDLRFKRAFTLLGVLPLAIPGYVMAYALLALGGPYGAAAQLFGVTLPRLNGYAGALIALTIYTFPYMFLNLRAALLGLDPTLEEAARSLGYRPHQVFLRVVLPQLRPAFYAGGLLVGLHVLGDFGVVSLMRFETFSYAIYLQYSAAYDREYAAWLALMLLTLTGGLLYLEARLLHRVRLDRIGTGVKKRAAPTPLGAWRPLAYGFALGLPLLAVGAPVLAIGYWMTRTSNPGVLTDLGEALTNSILASAPAAFLAPMLVLPIAYLSVRYPSRLSRFLERVAYIGYATPPLAFALALIFFSLNLVPFLYQTLALLVYAYTLHFLAEAIGPVRSALYQASPRVEEAAYSLGYTPFWAFWKVTFPVLRGGLLASTAFVFLSAMKELPLTFLLAPIGFETLATNVWGYTTEAMFAEAAPYALVILLASAGFVGLLLAQERRSA
ncbi:ABC-type transporter, integral membrane subunit [Marinithermus hydrothermalis DSM 14884]|uniref:ABC-type transporter, integral membrane subunit n=1 Tax=Marinithermus hydrothermalis (strain DSM 14884 / JCM 11576 / T1) TaxID=869210 RepID=F2NMT5_MARHT|nr:ABC-type transporter, integral membrane subunit [Marinithermus hydrothermalis DSM 14884]